VDWLEAKREIDDCHSADVEFMRDRKMLGQKSAVERSSVERKLKQYLILTGASAAGFFICIILHNVTYALFTYWFGADFWGKIGVPDEPFFFLLAIFVCPVLFLIGVVGSIVVFIKNRKNLFIAKKS